MTPTKEMLRIITHGRYLMWCQMQRDHAKDIEKESKLTPEDSFYSNMDVQRWFMYLSYWFAGLYAVCEGWQELKLSDPEVDRLLSSPYLNVLRRYRNCVFHFQMDYFDNRIKEAIQLGEPFRQWVDELMGQMNRWHLEWDRKHKPIIHRMAAAAKSATTVN